MSALTATPAPTAPNLDIARKRGPWRRVADVWVYRELLLNLTRKELKVKYKNSVLGFLWSLLNPLLYLVVYYVVFQYFLKTSIPVFAVFLLAGLLPWTFFSNALGAGTTSIVGNSSLVGKVWFPREILPLAAIGAAMVHFLLQSVVLIGALFVFGINPAWGYMPLLVPALLALVLFLAALTVALSAANVYLRDTQHLLELLVMAWFWLSPIVYPYRQAYDQLGRWGSLYLLNPMVSILITFQRIFYNKVSAGPTPILPDGSVWWYLRNLAIVGMASTVLLVGALVLFGRLEDDFAEEI
ncbi:MAG: ABC transporter permease [Acidimicrobiia bacterium]|nr:ABC transporter permease [Acidimicrobiia bacterium]